MDLPLLVLIALIIVTVFLATRFNRRSWSNQSGYQFRRVFSIAAFGLWFTVAGAIGWDVRHGIGSFGSAPGADGPLWWQLGAGVALLLVAVVLARRVTYPSRRLPRKA